MKPRVYLETTVISYLLSRPNRDIVVAGHQAVTRQWWERRRERYDLFVSEVVLREIGAGDPAAARERLDLVAQFPRLPLTDEAVEIAAGLVAPGLLPAKAGDDALHLALAVFHRMDFLLTWNCRHLANAELARAAYNRLNSLGLHTPLICTPDELWEPNDAQ